MTGLLSLTTFAPLVGVAVLLAVRTIKGDSAATDALAKWIALATTLVTFALSILLVAQFDAKNPGFQFVEDVAWFAGLHYRMGVDGISILFVLLTAFLLPICILASWTSIEKRVVEYLIAFLVLETLVIGVFCALD
ncbi:NADH-quinone oxidoreductase subunit M, partial [Pseudomonas sp. HMWF010]